MARYAQGFKYARYSAVGRITNSGKNVQFVLFDKTNSSRLEANRVQTAYLIGKDMIDNMTCTVNVKGGVQFELVDGSIKMLPVLQDRTVQKIQDSEKYKIIALIKDGKKTLGYRVQKGNEKPLNLQAPQIEQLQNSDRLLNAKVITNNGQKQLLGVGIKLRDLPVYTPGDLAAEQVAGKLTGSTNQLKTLLGKYGTTRVPPLYKQRILLDGEYKEIYQFTGKTETDKEADLVLMNVLKMQQFKVMLYAVVIVEQRRTNQMAVWCGIPDASTRNLDELRRATRREYSASELLTEGYYDFNNHRYTDYARVMYCRLKYIYKIQDKRKPDESYYLIQNIQSSSCAEIVNQKALEQFRLTLDRRQLGNIIIAQQLNILKIKDRILYGITGKTFGLGNTENSVEAGDKVRDNRKNQFNTEQNPFKNMDNICSSVIQVLAKNTRTTYTQQLQSWQKDVDKQTGNKMIQKIATFNINGTPKFKVRFLAVEFNGQLGDILTMQVVRSGGQSRTQDNKNIQMRLNLNQLNNEEQIENQLSKLLVLLNS